MNEISISLFYGLAGISLIFLLCALFLDMDKTKSLLFLIISTAGFYTSGQLMINGKVGVFYANAGTLLFNPIQSSTLYYFFLILGVSSFFLMVYSLYEIYLDYTTEKNSSAFEVRS